MKKIKFFQSLNTICHVLMALTVVILYVVPIWIYCLISCWRNKGKKIYKEFAYVSRKMLGALGVTLKINGRIPEIDEFFIVVCNHESWIDAFLISAYFNGRPGIVFIDKKMLKYPILGWFLRRVGAISLNSKNNSGVKSAYKKSLDILSENYIDLFIYPEGTRTRDGFLSRFKIGPFKLALKTNRRILVIGISGAYEFSNTNSWFLNPGMVVIHTGVLVDLEGKDEDELRDEVRCAMLDCMKKASIVRNS